MLVDRFVLAIDFELKLVETRVKPEECADREQPLSECGLRMSEDRAGLVVERAVEILAEIALKVAIAAVLTEWSEWQRGHVTPFR